MVLKGHTKIELTDVNTGQTEVREDDNMVTNALSFIANYVGGMFCNNPLYSMVVENSEESTIKNFTGGIMLFDDAIEENPNTIYTPAGVHVVGCGSGAEYSGSNVMAGSYNKVESGYLTDGDVKGYKHVWDFNTAQANGTISCACLTTQAGGKFTSGTYPYDSGYALSNEPTFLYQNKKIFLPDLDGAASGSMESIFSILFIDVEKNRILRAHSADEFKVSHMNNGDDFEKFKKSMFYKRAIDIDVCSFYIDRVGIFDQVDYLETVTVSMPSQLAALIKNGTLDAVNRPFGVDVFRDDIYIYVMFRIPPDNGTVNTYLIPEDSAYVWRISASDFTSTYFTVTNKTGENIFFNMQNNAVVGTSDAKRALFASAAGYVFLIGQSYTLYRINMENSEDFTEVTVKNASGDAGIVHISNHMDDAYYENGNLCFDSSPVKTVDVNEGTMRFKNGKLPGRTYRYTSNVFFTGGYLITFNQNSNYGLALMCDPALLVTINNLDSPVTKTANQSMKVTYTLTVVENGEETEE